MAQNEQTTEEHSTLEQQSPGRLDHPALTFVVVLRNLARIIIIIIIIKGIYIAQVRKATNALCRQRWQYDLLSTSLRTSAIARVICRFS